MKPKKTYPHCRVIFGSLLVTLIAPLIYLIFLELVSLIANNNIGKSLNYNIDKPSIIGTLALLFFIASIAIYSIPSLILGATLSCFKINAGIKGYFFSALSGGVIAIIWGIFIAASFGKGKGMYSDSNTNLLPISGISLYSDLLTFSLVALSSAIMAYFVLPKKGSYVESKNCLNDSDGSEFHDEALQFSASNLPEKQYFL